MEIVPLTIWREASGEGSEGMIAVAWVIANRARTGGIWPTDPERVCLQPFQFSSWNANDHGRKRYPEPNDPQYEAACSIWRGIQGSEGTDLDPTGGATWYLNPQAVPRNPFHSPDYVQTAVIGKHVFYKAT